MDAYTSTRYRHWRGIGVRAEQAIIIARSERKVRDLSAELEWFWPDNAGQLDPFVYTTIVHAGYSIRIEVLTDPEPYDWGDDEPSEWDRENLQAIGVRLVIGDDDREDALWGIGFTDGDWEKAALEVIVGDCWLESAREWIDHENAERADAAARDIETV